MSREPIDLSTALGTLRPKAKDPTSARVLDTWIAQAEHTIGAASEGGRLGWLVASTVVTAALQRAIDAEGESRFLLKGGTLLQHRLGLAARTTRDLDGLVRGDIESFLPELDEALKLPWGPLGLRRSEVEIIDTPARVLRSVSCVPMPNFAAIDRIASYSVWCCSRCSITRRRGRSRNIPMQYGGAPTRGLDAR